MSPGIEWQEPGPLAIGKWEKMLAPVCAKRGRWAVVATWPKAEARRSRAACRDLRAGSYRIPPGEWEFASRIEGDVARLYARWNGMTNGSRKPA